MKYHHGVPFAFGLPALTILLTLTAILSFILKRFGDDDAEGAGHDDEMSHHLASHTH